MTKYTMDRVLGTEKSYKSIAEERNVGLSPLKRWADCYLEHGMEELASSYTNEKRNQENIARARSTYYYGVNAFGREEKYTN
ncbi:transposase [Peribacillus simplex]